MSSPYQKFYLKTIAERKKILTDLNLYNPSLDKRLDDESFNNLIENYLTTFELPVGIVPNLLIDNKYYNGVLATEEPSVIAGCSNACGIINASGGFKIEYINRQMTGQIIFKDVHEPLELVLFLESRKEEILNIAKTAHPKISKLGGGLKDFTVEIKPHNFVCFYGQFDTKDAMGANTINIILESVASYIKANSSYQILMSILSNYTKESIVKASVIINPSCLKNHTSVAKDISLANLYATVDQYRCVTHNKGIMNGISAVMLATGNDTRAIEASIHAYAAKSGSYQPLTKWIVLENGFLFGQIKVPLPLGTVGGAMQVLPKVKLAHKIMGIKDSYDLMKIAACIGLASNFAALYALTTDGINKGHLRLHAKSIAVSVKCPKDKIDQLVEYLIKENDISEKKALEFLKKNT